MVAQRSALPHETSRIFLTDGGTETFLIHKRGLDLPYFSSFHLLGDAEATEEVKAYYRAFANIAVEHGTAFIFDSLTYRASTDWGDLLGYSPGALAEMNLMALELYREVARESGMADNDVIISGCIGPKGDAYERNEALTAGGAQEYHQVQIDTFKSGKVDVVTALSLSSSDEAIGIVRAARTAGLPSAISFMLEKDHRLGSGETLQAAIETVDQATGNGAAYFMVNCSHPMDIDPALTEGDWVKRVHGIRANASKQEHSLLNTLGHLDEGDPDELASEYANLKSAFPHMNVFGGCCGTDFNHVRRISSALHPK
ncbi:MAG: homocysteine methyltransferase [Proteobacteria bacterium]|nr:homocysteine methyltransferase [Pseudomonadota bacterium]